VAERPPLPTLAVRWARSHSVWEGVPEGEALALARQTWRAVQYQSKTIGVSSAKIETTVKARPRGESRPGKSARTGLASTIPQGRGVP